MMNAYVMSSLLWAIAGFACGYLIGHAAYACTVEREKVAVPNRALRADNALGVVIIILALASVVTMAFTVRAHRDQVECQTAFNTHFSAALEERSEAAARERAAQRKLLTTITTDESSRAQAIQEYVRQLDQADGQRARNPLPLQPDCG